MQSAGDGRRLPIVWFTASLMCAPFVTVNSTLAQQVTQTESPPAVSSTKAIPTAIGAYSSTRSSSDTGTGPIRLGPGDLVEVAVYNVPELTTKARVSTNGDIYLPLIDYVHIGDLTQEEAQKLIEKRLASGGFLNNPHVTLFISEYASGVVTLLGEVARPGSYPVMGERRLYDIFSAAGGLSEKAGRNVTITHRNDPDHPISVRLAENLVQTPATNVSIQQGDTIVVQRAGIVYVVGDVGRPSGFLMDNDQLTVLRAIALAGGTTRTAKLNGAKLLRKTPEGIRETPVALNKILQAKAPDVAMQAEDVLFVPSSARKVAVYRGAEAVMQTATALSIIAVPRP